MKKVLILSKSDIVKDPRVLKQVGALQGEYEIVVFGYSSGSGVDFSFVDIGPYFGLGLKEGTLAEKAIEAIAKFGWRATIRIMLLRIFSGLSIPYWLYRFVYLRMLNFRIALSIAREGADLIIANDIDALPISVTGKGKSKILFDAHEYSPGQNSDSNSGRKKNLRAGKTLQDYLPYINGMMTVSEGIAEKYHIDFGIEKPVVVMNAAEYTSIEPSVCETDLVRLVHHGVAFPGRGIEDLIELAGSLDRRFSLDFFLVASSKSYLQSLKDLASGNPRISFNEPIPRFELIRRLNGFDIGIYLLSPTCFNHEYALPNKLFEFIQARLGIATYPSPEMATMVRRFNLGVVSSGFSIDSMARALGCITKEDLGRYKENAHAAAAKLSVDSQMEIIKETVNRCISL